MSYFDHQRYDSPRHRLMFKLVERKRSRQPKHCSAYLLGIGFGPRKLNPKRKISIHRSTGRQVHPRALLATFALSRCRFDGYIRPKIIRRKRMRRRMERIRAAIKRLVK